MIGMFGFPVAFPGPDEADIIMLLLSDLYFFSRPKRLGGERVAGDI